MKFECQVCSIMKTVSLYFVDIIRIFQELSYLKVELEL